nr:hypothetical protein Iba_chr11fCG7020 [Ipomoea batatas]
MECGRRQIKSLKDKARDVKRIGDRMAAIKLVMSQGQHRTGYRADETAHKSKSNRNKKHRIKRRSKLHTFLRRCSWGIPETIPTSPRWISTNASEEEAENALDSDVTENP